MLEDRLKLYTPDFIIDELLEHENLILKKTKRTREGFVQIMHMLKDIITVIPAEEYAEFMKEAKKISPDEDDEIYFALALKLKCGLWSNEKKLKEQDKVAVYSTSEVVKLI